MAKWRIDSIQVITSGQPEARYADVFVDDNGIVTHEAVPGKKFIGNTPLTSFPVVNRQAFYPPLAFTTFCNYTTFTKNRIFASVNSPFAYNLPEVNSPECGYEEPVPTPGVPYSPFGTPNYGDYAYFEYCDRDGRLVQMFIRKKNYTGSVRTIKFKGKTPIVISRPSIEELEVIAKTECKVTLVATENFEFSDFFTEDERMFQGEVVKDGITEFKGYLQPDFGNEKFDSPATEVMIRFTDGLSQLKQVTYPIPLGGTTAQRQSFKDILCYCFAPLNLNLNVSTIVNQYATTNKTGLNDDPMAQNSISPLRLVDDKGTTLTSYEVLETIAKSFRAVIVQDGGEWHFVRRKELVLGTSRRRIYDYKGVFLYAEQYISPRIVGRETT